MKSKKIITFLEAVKAKSESKTVYSELCDATCIYKGDNFLFEDKDGRGVSAREILEGVWHVDED